VRRRRLGFLRELAIRRVSPGVKSVVMVIEERMKRGKITL
jgi:hypothetical protein